MFDRNIHIRPHREVLDLVRSRPRDWELYSSFDPGTSSVFANLQVAINKYNKQVLILNEIYETNQHQTVSRLIYPRALKLQAEVDEFNGHWVQLYDYAAAWFATEIQHEFGEAVLPCTKDLKNKENKLSLIKDILLRTDSFLISDRCPKTAWELENYAKDDNGKIPKENDHNIDNLRYILNQASYHSVPHTEVTQSVLDNNSHRRYHTPDSDLHRDREQLHLMGALDDLDMDDYT